MPSRRSSSPFDAIVRIGQRLRGYGADAGLDVRHPAADREVLGRHRDAERAGGSRAMSDHVIVSSLWKPGFWPHSLMHPALSARFSHPDGAIAFNFSWPRM